MMQTPLEHAKQQMCATCRRDGALLECACMAIKAAQAEAKAEGDAEGYRRGVEAAVQAAREAALLFNPPILAKGRTATYILAELLPAESGEGAQGISDSYHRLGRLPQEPGEDEEE